DPSWLAPEHEEATQHEEATRRGQAGEPAPEEVRAWAAENNIDVHDRGRIPREVVAHYLQAHPAADSSR
ncbi:MAG: hypothetical protein GEV04_24070, partial [Actinophytocola sp.]|nr:hypothetical protein [Actinophytocola sp.]